MAYHHLLSRLREWWDYRAPLEPDEGPYAALRGNLATLIASFSPEVLTSSLKCHERLQQVAVDLSHLEDRVAYLVQIVEIALAVTKQTSKRGPADVTNCTTVESQLLGMP